MIKIVLTSTFNFNYQYLESQQTFLVFQRLKDVFSVAFSIFQDVFNMCLQDVFQKRLQDVFKTSSKTPSRHLQDMLVRCLLQEVSKTFSTRLQHVFTNTNFCWASKHQWWNLFANIVNGCFKPLTISTKEAPS